MYKVGFILNGKGRRKKQFYKELNQARKALKNIEFSVVETTRTGHAISLAFEFAGDNCTHIIAIGGDGTLHEAINGLMKNGGADVVVGLLPYGTANDFTKTLKVPESLADLFESISKDRTTRIDVGKIEHRDGQRFFINIADLGIGAEVVKRVNKTGKWMGANLTFFKAIIQTFLTFKNQPISCTADDWKYEGKINSLVAANGKYFGSGLCIAPEADPTDGKFSVIISGDITINDYLKNVKKIKRGELIQHPEVQYKVATKISITSEVDCGIEADGEFIGFTPATLSIADRKIRFLIV